MEHESVVRETVDSAAWARAAGCAPKHGLARSSGDAVAVHRG